MAKHNFDVTRICGDGYLVLPLSMSRLSSGQSPEKVYEILQCFIQKLSTFATDVVFLYTSGLYLSSAAASFELRQKINNQMMTHSIRLKGLIKKRKEFVPGAFHYLPSEYFLVNATCDLGLMRYCQMLCSAS